MAKLAATNDENDSEQRDIDQDTGKADADNEESPGSSISWEDGDLGTLTDVDGDGNTTVEITAQHLIIDPPVRVKPPPFKPQTDAEEIINNCALNGEADCDWSTLRPLIEERIVEIFNLYNRDYQDPIVEEAPTPVAEKKADESSSTDSTPEIGPVPLVVSQPVSSLTRSAAIDNSSTAVKHVQSSILSCLGEFVFAPFTVQRLCEVVLEPERYYETAAKLTRGIRKILEVSPAFTQKLDQSILQKAHDASLANKDASSNNLETKAEKDQTDERESKRLREDCDSSDNANKKFQKLEGVPEES